MTIRIASLCLLTLSLYAQICPAPAPTVGHPPGSSSDQTAPFIFTGFADLVRGSSSEQSEDLTGNAVYGFCPLPAAPLLTRYMPDSRTFLGVIRGVPSRVMEVDVDTNATVGSTNMTVVNQQLAALGAQQVIDFNHEAIRLPNGFTALIAHNERLETNVQGPGTVDVMGDEVLVLDTNWNVVWTWNAFDWLDVSRAAILGETCTPTRSNGGCAITLAPIANDWLHGNSLNYDPTDGNLVMSLRHQDWVIKIAYQDGAGDGHVIWRLGNQGDFAMLNTHHISSPWFTHQHDAGFWGAAHAFALFDNGNTRKATDRTANSRAQVYTIDESRMTADLSMNVDLGWYAPSYGSAQLLANGNWWFDGGNAPGHVSRMREFQPNPDGTGTVVFAISFDTSSYRAFRIEQPPLEQPK